GISPSCGISITTASVAQSTSVTPAPRMSSASTARCGQRAAAVAIWKGRRVTLHVTLVSHLEIEARPADDPACYLRGLHHLLKSDEIGVERGERAVDNLRSSSIAFAVPYI